jgi:hypothetical protein
MSPSACCTARSSRCQPHRYGRLLLLATAVRERPHQPRLSCWYGDVVVATKVGPARDPAGEWLTMAPPEQLRGQVEQNCASSAGPLGRGGPASQRPHMASVTGHFGALAELRQAGLTRHLGLSNVSPQHVAEALTIAPVVCVHNSYGLNWRRADDRGLADLCRKQGIAFVPYFAVSGLRREAAAVQGARCARPVRGARSRCDAGPRAAGVDTPPGSARAGHSRHHEPGAPRREHRRHNPAPDRGAVDCPRQAGRGTAPAPPTMLDETPTLLNT